MNHSFDIEHARLYGLPEAVIIHNFAFWITQNRANGTNQRAGHTWTYNSIPALELIFPYLTYKQIRRATDSLVKMHLVLITGYYNALPGDRTTWYAFADEAKFLPIDHLPKKADGAPKRADGVPKRADHCTDVNTDVNTDINTLSKQPSQITEPGPVKKGASDVTSVDLSITARKNGVMVTPADPRLIALAEQGVSVEILAAACAYAKEKRGDDVKPIPLGYILAILTGWATEAKKINVAGVTKPAARGLVVAPMDLAAIQRATTEEARRMLFGDKNTEVFDA